MPRPVLRRPPRGSTLVLAMVLLAVLSLLGVAAVSLSLQERTSSSAKARRDLQVACANAARLVIYAELARHGTAYFGSTAAWPSVTLPDGTQLSQSHYDTPAGVSVKDIVPMRILPVSSDPASAGTADLTNTFDALGKDSSTARGYEVVARCQDSKGRDLEVEFVVAFAL